MALIPILLTRWVLKKDRTLFAYLGFNLPEIKPTKELCFLLYAVSVGEVKAVSSLFARMKKAHPEASFHIVCRTKTGLEEAKRTLATADSYSLLPFDFSFLSRKLINRIAPDILLVVEGDLWYNFLKAARDRGVFVCLVSGKISLRSYRRFSYFPYLAKKLFSLFTLICAQNSIFAKRFVSLGVNPSSVIVTGNIKLEAKKEILQPKDQESLRRKLGIEKGDFTLVVGSTHAPEEKEIIKALQPVLTEFPHVKCLLVPRHKERFSEVEKVLSSMNIPFISFSNILQRTGEEQIFLVDQMGLLSDLYQIADLAIVGGSFEAFLKGHNIVEPIQAGAPVLFGPYMESQTDLVDLVLSFQAGMQVDYNELFSVVERSVKMPSTLDSFRLNGGDLLLHVEGATLRAWLPIEHHLKSCDQSIS